MFRTIHGGVFDPQAIEDGYGLCFVCGIVPVAADGTGCRHPGHQLCCGPRSASWPGSLQQVIYPGTAGQPVRLA